MIPEGIYKITHFNPNSKFYLSLGINYPNENDLKRAFENKITKPGGEIFIHGSDKTVGCVPIGNDGIEEIFFIVHKIKKENVKVVISPVTNDKFSTFLENISKVSPLLAEKYTKIGNQLKSLVE